VEPLKNVQVVVPAAVTLGNHVTLSCLYDLEHNESLYAVKWYLGEEEFYRYVPKEVPPTQFFPITGLEIDVRETRPPQKRYWTSFLSEERAGESKDGGDGRTESINGENTLIFLFKCGVRHFPFCFLVSPGHMAQKEPGFPAVDLCQPFQSV